MRDIALIDGDLLLYQFAHRGQMVYEWAPGITTIVLEDEQKVVDELMAFLGMILKKTQCDQYRIALSASRSFRYDILSSYKHNRINTVKPVLYPKLKEVLLGLNAIVKPKLEADDVLGIMTTKAALSDAYRYIVCSIDKDLKQIPGWHFNWEKDSSPRYITLAEADKFFYLQALMGDPGDGYSGCPRIGPRKAEKILNGVTDPVEIWFRILKTYEKAGCSESYALAQTQVARICRVEDYDFTNNEPIWWTPPTQENNLS